MKRMWVRAEAIFLIHPPGGPFYAKKEDGAWSIPQGEFEDEDSLTAARRELEEETGFKIAGVFDRETH
ncbi:MAG TPA: NUDIX domain-containing protein [Pyrinomonadaceae bacterium]|nr:NUDIX domain-containing protein [Pyrinomonadaceae bacterium]